MLSKFSITAPEEWIALSSEKFGDSLVGSRDLKRIQTESGDETKIERDSNNSQKHDLQPIQVLPVVIYHILQWPVEQYVLRHYRWRQKKLVV